jgi:hypothetical protein
LYWPPKSSTITVSCCMNVLLPAVSQMIDRYC